MKAGPRKITFKCKLFKFGFNAHGNEICFMFEAGPKKSFYPMKSSQVRKLRNWLNWFLDNK